MGKNTNKKNHKGSSDGGRLLHISPHPPDFVSAPWYNLVVRLENPGVFITSVGLQAALASQLGITFTNSNIDIRFQSVRVWGALTSGTTPLGPINVVIFDPVVAGAGLTRVLEQLTDYPDQVRRACIGYKYPKAQREVAFRLANTGAVNILATNGLGANSVIYFKVQWRPGNTVPPARWLQQALKSTLFSDDEDDDIEVLSSKSLKQQQRPRNH